MCGGGPPAKGVGNHDNPVNGHQHQGTVRLIEISGEQVSWALPIPTNNYPKGGGGGSKSDQARKNTGAIA